MLANREGRDLKETFVGSWKLSAFGTRQSRERFLPLFSLFRVWKWICESETEVWGEEGGGYEELFLFLYASSVLVPLMIADVTTRLVIRMIAFLFYIGFVFIPENKNFLYFLNARRRPKANVSLSLQSLAVFFFFSLINSIA